MKRLDLKPTGLVLGIAGVAAVLLVQPQPLAVAKPVPQASGAGVAGDCEQLGNQAERATCFAVQLREAERVNDRLIKKLTVALGESEGTSLQDTQRDWAATRNQRCGLPAEGADYDSPGHERWLQAILRDPAKTACVLKETNQRVLNMSAIDSLQDWMHALQNKPYAAAPPAPETRHQGFAPGAADCAQPANDGERTACLGSLLRDTDATLNRLYKVVARGCDRAGRKRLLEEQRSWLAARTRTCSLDESEADRDRWLQAVLADSRKTTCVLQMTRERIVVLAQSLPDR